MSDQPVALYRLGDEGVVVRSIRALLQATCDLAPAVSGGSPHTLREQELVRRSGHSLTGRTVVLDPGHGGDETGTIAHGLTESEVTLDLARRVEGRLGAIGVTVLFTRST